MLNLKLNYYSHLLLTNKYSFVIKLTVLLCIYMLFTLDNTNEIAYCMKKKALAKAVVPTITETTTSTPIRPIGDIFELERMKVHEKIIAYTHMEPEELISTLERHKALDAETTKQPIELFSLPVHEKKYIQGIIPQIQKHQLLSDSGLPGGFFAEQISMPDEIGARKVYYLLRMYRRLMGI